MYNKDQSFNIMTFRKLFVYSPHSIKKTGWILHEKISFMLFIVLLHM